MASVVANDETTNNYNNSDDTDDLTKLGKRAQTDYTKFDNVEDVPDDESALDLALKLKTEGNGKFKTTDFKGAIDKYTEALNTIGNESSSAKKDLTEQEKADRTNCKLSMKVEHQVLEGDMLPYLVDNNYVTFLNLTILLLEVLLEVPLLALFCDIVISIFRVLLA